MYKIMSKPQNIVLNVTKNTHKNCVKFVTKLVSHTNMYFYGHKINRPKFGTNTYLAPYLYYWPLNTKTKRV